MRAHFNRVRLVRNATLRQAMRERLPGAMLLVMLVFLAAAWTLHDFNFGAPALKFTLDLGLGVLGFFGTILAIVATVPAVLGEFERRTAGLMFVRGVGPAVFVTGKFSALWLLAAAFCAGLGGLTATVLLAQAGGLDGGAQVDWARLGLVLWAEWLELGVVIAAMVLVSSFARSQAFALMAGFVLAAVFHLSFVLGHVAAEHGGGWVGWGARVLGWALPDFQLIHAGAMAPAVAGWRPWLQLAAYALPYMVLFCGLAVPGVQRREN